MGIDATLGVKSASEFIFFILTLPSGGYFKGAGEGPGAIDVLVSQSVVRAAPGGMGNVKAGGELCGHAEDYRGREGRSAARRSCSWTRAIAGTSRKWAG